MTRRHLLWLLIAGGVLRVIAMPLAGTTDVLAWREWGAIAATDFGGTYGAAPGEITPFGYPPVGAATLATVSRADQLLNPDDIMPRAFNVLVKLPGVLSEWVLALALLFWVGRRVSTRAAQDAAIDVWLNPAMLLAGAALGYLDTQAAVPGVLALMALVSGAPVTAGLLAVIACLTKPQGILLLPAFALMCLQQPARQSLRAGAAAMCVAVLAFLPFALRGTLPNLIASLDANVADMASGQAANVWWLATAWTQQPWRDVVTWASSTALTDAQLPHTTLIGVSVTASVLALGLWRSRHVRRLDHALLLSAWCVHTHFTFNVFVHENHLALAVPFVVVAASLHREWRPLAAALSLIVVANLALFYGLGENGWRLGGGYPALAIPVMGLGLAVLVARTARALPRPALVAAGGAVAWSIAGLLLRGSPYTLESIRMSAGLDLTVVLACVNVAVFAWHTRTLWQMGAADSASIDA